MAIKSHISLGRFASLNNNNQNQIGVNSVIAQLYKLFNQYSKNYTYIINQWNAFCDLNNIDTDYKLYKDTATTTTNSGSLDSILQKIDEFDMRLKVVEQLAKSDTSDLCETEWIFYLLNPVPESKVSISRRIALDKNLYKDTLPNNALSDIIFYSSRKEAFIFKLEFDGYLSVPTGTGYEIFSKNILIPKDISYTIYLGKAYIVYDSSQVYGSADMYCIISGKKHGKPITNKWFYWDING